MGRLSHSLDNAFLDTFGDLLPQTLPTEGQRSKFLEPTMSQVKNESDLYSQLKMTIDSVLEAASSRGSIPLCSMKSPWHKADEDPNGPRDTVTDPGIYFDNDEARKAIELTKDDHKRSRLEGEELKKHMNVVRRSWHHIVVPIEVKYRPDEAAFYDTGHGARVDKLRKATPGKQMASTNSSAGQDRDTPSPEKNENAETKDGERALGQLVEYLLNVFKSQHRLYCWAIYVCKEEARLLHVDRTGAYVSTFFVWTNVNSLLHDFVWKIAHMSHAQLGFDPTTSLASPAEKAEIDTALADPELDPIIKEYAERGLRGSEASEANFPIYKIRVPVLTPTPPSPASSDDEDPLPTDEGSNPLPATKDADYLEFLVGLPHFSTEAVVGRCTKGFIALRLGTGTKPRFSYVKDFWRPLVPGRTRPEHLIYQRLHAHNVRNIAHLICAGDVAGPRAQVSRVHSFLHNAAKNPAKHLNERRALPVARCHYRLVTEEIGIPLTDFGNFKELANAIVFAVHAHQDAWEKAKIIHRDISVGNIMINPITWSAFLIDWDLARSASELNGGASEPNHTGTWQFRSALSLRYPWKPYRISDDVESFVHVFEYLVWRYHLTDFGTALHTVVHHKYDSCVMAEDSPVGHIKIGGDAKLDDFKSRIASRIKLVDNPKLQAVLDQLALNCHRSYSKVDPTRMERRYGVTGRSRVSLPAPRKRPAAPSARFPILKELMMDVALKNSKTQASDPLHDLNDDTDAHDEDSSEITGFLTSHTELTKTLYLYVLDGLDEDKAEDQFKARMSTRTNATGASPTMHVSRMSCSRTTTTGVAMNVVGFPMHIPHDSANSEHQTPLDVEDDNESSASGDEHPVHYTRNEFVLKLDSGMEEELPTRSEVTFSPPPSALKRSRAYVDAEDTDEDGASESSSSSRVYQPGWSKPGTQKSKKKRAN